jgi:hypothetical protein
VQRAPGIPYALCFEGETFKTSGASRRETAKAWGDDRSLHTHGTLPVAGLAPTAPFQNPNSWLLHLTLFWVGYQRTIEFQRGETE